MAAQASRGTALNARDLLRVAVAACFPVASLPALAQLNLTTSPATGILKYAKEIPSDTTNLSNNGLPYQDIVVPVPQSYQVTGGNPLYVTFSLTGGATFGSMPGLRCGDGATTASSTVTQGGAGSSGVTFLVSNTTSGTTGTCYMSAGNLGLAINGLVAVSVSAQVEYKRGLANVLSGAGGSTYVTFVKGVSATIAEADGDVVVDVANDSLTWTLDSNRASASLATLGWIGYHGVPGTALAANTLGNIDPSAVITTASVTINGSAIAAAVQVNDVSGVFLDATSSACTTVSYTSDSSSGTSVTFNVNQADLATAQGVTVCINVSGNSSEIGAGQVTGSMTSATSIANVTPDLSGGPNLENVRSNGATRNVYLVHASTSTSRTSVLRIINLGKNATKFVATAFQIDSGVQDANPVDRTVIGTANSVLGVIPSEGALNLTSAQLEQKLGFTPPASGMKYRLVITAGTEALQVLSYTRDLATGRTTLSQFQED